MAGLIARTHQNCGFKCDVELIDSTIDELVNDIQRYFGIMTFGEINLSFKNGWKGQYGEFYGLNSATYFKWINNYNLSDKRANAKKALAYEMELLNNPKPKELTPEEKHKILIGGLLKSFDDFKKGVILLDAGNVNYNYLDNLGLIRFSPERKQIILNTVKERIKQDIINNKNRGVKLHDALKTAFDNADSLKSEAKKEALKQYFKELIDMNIELTDVINQK